MINNIMSICVQTDGAWGNPCIIAGIVYSPEGEELNKICFRLSNEFISDYNIKKNLNYLGTYFPATHSSNNFFDQFAKGESKKRAYESMLKDFAEWYDKYSDSQIIWHNAHEGASYLFREINRLRLLKKNIWLPIEISETLRQHGYSQDGVISYALWEDLKEKYDQHSPLYECYVMMEIYKQLCPKGYKKPLSSSINTHAKNTCKFCGGKTRLIYHSSCMNGHAECIRCGRTQ